MSVRDFAEMINRLTGNQAGVVLEDKRIAGDPQQRRPDITRARQLLGWEPRVELEDGLRQTIAYFKGRV
jgi:dTDP-glucose 4,6-dehydratase